MKNRRPARFDQPGADDPADSPEHFRPRQPRSRSAWMRRWTRIAFLAVLIVWGALLIDQYRVNTGHASSFTWMNISGYDWTRRFPQHLEPRIDMSRHGVKGLLICFTILPFLLHWAWGKGGEERRSRRLYGLVLLLLVVPALLTLLLALKHLGWPPSSANWVARGLFFSVMLAALPFLPGVRSLSPLRQVLFFAVAAVGYQIAVSALNTGNAAGTHNHLDIGHWRMVSIVWNTLFWIPTWWVAIWSAAVVAAVSAVAKPWHGKCPFLIAGMALGLFVGGTTASPRVWSPPLLWRSFEERAFPLSPEGERHRLVIGDFSQGATIGWDIDFYARFKRTLLAPTGTPMERSALKPGEYIYQGDQFRDIDTWWAAAEGRLYKLRRHTQNVFAISFLLPDPEDLTRDLE